MKKITTTTQVFSMDLEELRVLLIGKLGADNTSKLEIHVKGEAIRLDDGKILLRYNGQQVDELP